MPCDEECPAGFQVEQRCHDAVVETIIDSEERGSNTVFTPPLSLDDTSSLWALSTSTRVLGYFGNSSFYTRRQSQLSGSIRFDFTVAVAGRYRVSVSYAAKSNRHSRVPTEIEHQDGSTSVLVNHRIDASDCRAVNANGDCVSAFESVGEYVFTGRGSVTVHHHAFSVDTDRSIYKASDEETSASKLKASCVSC